MWSFSFNSRSSSIVAHGCSTYSISPIFSEIARRLVMASATDQLPLTSIRSFASGRSALTFARRARSSVKLSPTFTLKVVTPGKEFTMPSISSESLSAGSVPFTVIDRRKSLGRGLVAASIAHSSHGAHSASLYSRNGENSPQPYSPLKSAASRTLIPRKLVFVGSATTRIVSSRD